MTFKNCSIDNLLDDLRGADWKVDSEDVDLNWNHWKRIFTGILDYHAPVVRCCVHKDAIPWIDKDIRKKTHEEEISVAEAGLCEW